MQSVIIASQTKKNRRLGHLAGIACFALLLCLLRIAILNTKTHMPEPAIFGLHERATYAISYVDDASIAWGDVEVTASSPIIQRRGDSCLLQVHMSIRNNTETALMVEGTEFILQVNHHVFSVDPEKSKVDGIQSTGTSLEGGETEEMALSYSISESDYITQSEYERDISDEFELVLSTTPRLSVIELGKPSEEV